MDRQRGQRREREKEKGERKRTRKPLQSLSQIGDREKNARREKRMRPKKKT